MKGNISCFCNATKDDARHFKLRSFPNGLGGYWKCLSGTGTNCRFPLIRQIGSMEYCISIKGLVITSKAVLLFLAINLKRGYHHCKIHKIVYSKPKLMTLRLLSLEAIPIKTQSLFFICCCKSLQIEKEGQLPNTSEES